MADLAIIMESGSYNSFRLSNLQVLTFGRLQVYPVCKFGINTCNALDISFICRAALQFCTISQFSSVLAVAGNINVCHSEAQNLLSSLSFC